jgi:hypothetical protein
VFLFFFFIISFWDSVIASGQLGRGGSDAKIFHVFITVGEKTNGFRSVIDAQQDLWCLLMYNCNYIKKLSNSFKPLSLCDAILKKELLKSSQLFDEVGALV